MSLTVADIQRWDAEAVREVAAAAAARARAFSEAAAGLDALPALGSWRGAGAEAAAAAVLRTRAELQDRTQQALAVAESVGRAAERIEAITGELARLRCEIEVYQAEILGGTVVARPGSAHSRAVIPPLQLRLDGIVEQANSVDAELIAALGGSTAPAAPAAGPPALSRTLPDDPAAVNDLWQRIGVAERDAIFRRDPAVGNRPGLPAGSASDPGKDHYNRLHLAAELARASAAGSANLADLQALDRVLAANPGLRLMLLDTSGERLRAAVAAGDPDTATHVSVTTPGLNTTVAGSLEAMAGEAIALRQRATEQLRRTPGRNRETVASIAWIGYDAPQIHVSDGPVEMLRGAVGVSHDRVAGGAARDLSRFYAGLQAARPAEPAHLTAIGHSYGSLTTGLALQQPGVHGVSDAVFYGSPGIKASAPGDLGLSPGHVFVMETGDDPIQWVFDVPAAARALAPVIPGPLDDALLGAAELSGAGKFGPNPAENPAFVQMETGALWGMGAAYGHSDYPRGGVGADARTAAHNIAAVVAGLNANIIRR